MPKARKKRQPSQKQLVERAVKRALTRYHKLFRLPNWPVYYLCTKSLTRAWDGGECIAAISVDHDLNEVRLDYRDDLKLKDVDLVIAHEFVHWLVADLELFLQSSLGKRQYKHSKVLLESLVEAIALAVVNPPRKKPSFEGYEDQDEETR